MSDTLVPFLRTFIRLWIFSADYGLLGVLFLFLDTKEEPFVSLMQKLKKVVTIDITTKVLYILVVIMIITIKKIQGGNGNENSSCLCKWKSR